MGIRMVGPGDRLRPSDGADCKSALRMKKPVTFATGFLGIVWRWVAYFTWRALAFRRRAFRAMKPVASSWL